MDGCCFTMPSLRQEVIRATCMGAAVLATLSDRRACSTVIGLALTFSPLAGVFGFARLGWSFVPILAAIVVGYALLVESMKAFFYRRALGIGSSSR